LGVPEKNFTLSTVFAAAIVGHAYGNAEGTFRMKRQIILFIFYYKNDFLV